MVLKIFADELPVGMLSLSYPLHSLAKTIVVTIGLDVMLPQINTHKENKVIVFNVPIFYHFLFMFQLLSNVINCSQMQYHYII